MTTKKTIFELHSKLNFIILNIFSFTSILILLSFYEIFQFEYFINNFTSPLIDFFKSDNYKISVVLSTLGFLFLNFKNKKYDKYKFISIMFLIHSFYSFSIPYLTNIRESYLDFILTSTLLIFSISVLLLKFKDKIDFIKLYFFFIFILIFSIFSKEFNISLILSFIWILFYIIVSLFIQKNQFKKYIILQKIKTIFCILPYISSNKNIKSLYCQQLSKILLHKFKSKFIFIILILFFNFTPFTIFYLNDNLNNSFFWISFLYFVVIQIEFSKYLYHNKRFKLLSLKNDFRKNRTKYKKGQKIRDIIFFFYAAYSFYYFDLFNNFDNVSLFQENAFLFIISVLTFIIFYSLSFFLIPILIVSTMFIIVYEIKTNECFNSIIKIKIINGLSFFINENNFNTIENIQINLIKQINFNEDELLFLYKTFNFFHDGKLVVSDEILYSIVNKYRIAKQIKLKENLNFNDSFECLIEPYKESINKNKKIYNYLNS